MPKHAIFKTIISLIVQYNRVEFCLNTKRSSVYNVPKTGLFAMHSSDDIHIKCTSLILRAFVLSRESSLYLNVNIFGTMHANMTGLWNFIHTGQLCVEAKFNSIVLHNQGENRLGNIVIWRYLCPIFTRNNTL